MWDEIQQHGIVGYKKDPTGNFITTIPEGAASLAAWRLMKMAWWINDEFVRDAAAHPEVFF